MATDLWPNDIAASSDTSRSPLLLLREQASLLGNKTQNIVEAKIKTQTQPDWFAFPDKMLQRSFSSPETENNAFVHTFNLVAPALQNYTYQLFRVVHPIESYPARVFFLDNEIPVNSEDELKERLQQIFAHDKTKQVIAALITQSRQ